MLHRLLVPLLLSCGLHAQDPIPAPAPDPVRTTIQRAITWIEAQAKPVKGQADAVLFPAAAETPRARAAQVYGGSAGVLIFLENAAAVLDDARARTLADATARGFLATQRKDDDGSVSWMSRGMTDGSNSLYVGDAGIGHAFLVRARLRDDKDALAVALAVGDSILRHGKREDDRLHWDQQVEMIYGASGTIVFLLELAETTGEARFTAAALAAARWLIQESTVDEPEGTDGKRRRSWRWALAGNRAYVNFSHGTAGVAYALARVGAAVGDAACLQAALDGVAWLDDLAIREEGRVVWPVIAGSKTTMGGWCHGPPGTARLYLYLHSLTGEQRYLDTALASARWVMAQAPAAGSTAPAPKFPPSLCCGVAGVLDFFCDLYRVTGDAEFAAFARRAAGFLIDGAVADGEGVKWPGGATHAGANTQHGVDLMLGAPGEALALLRLLTLDVKVDPVRHLPDRRVRK